MRRGSFGAAPPPRRLFFRHRAVHPGAFLESRYLTPLRLTQDGLAKRLGISRRRVNELINGRRAITPDTAIRLGMTLGTGPEFWLALQQSWDVAEAWKEWRRMDAGVCEARVTASRDQL